MSIWILRAGCGTDMPDVRRTVELGLGGLELGTGAGGCDSKGDNQPPKKGSGGGALGRKLSLKLYLGVEECMARLQGVGGV